MMSLPPRLRRLWKELQEQLWFKPAWWGLLATVVALMAAFANRLIPEDLVPDIEQQTLQSLLTIIASSMLSVSTFSLSILVQAFSSAAGSASPRALRVVMADDNAQTAIAAFIAAFIYAVIALMALGVGYYGPIGRFMLLIFTIVVMVNVIIMLIRWIRTLSRLGRMGYTISRVEDAARTALQKYWRQPALGGQLMPADTPVTGHPVQAKTTGHVQHVDMAALDGLAESLNARVQLWVRPGAFVHRGQTLLTLDGAKPDAEQADHLRDAVEIGADRNFDQDPRFGLIVLSEIGQRALSPAVNDPGTAINVAGAITRVLIDTWPSPADAKSDAPAPEALSTRVFVLPIDEADFVRDAFAPLQRDAGGIMEAQLRFIKLLENIANTTGGALAKQARHTAWQGWLHAREQLTLERDRQTLEAAARDVAGSAAT
ncbi:MAG: DUF2254 domain-containing protein [Comamonadaceae bacterium]|nr:DUF2254 domain-containing protein [Comamonadaceae bacterium]